MQRCDHIQGGVNHRTNTSKATEAVTQQPTRGNTRASGSQSLSNTPHTSQATRTPKQVGDPYGSHPEQRFDSNPATKPTGAAQADGCPLVEPPSSLTESALPPDLRCVGFVTILANV